MQRVLDMKRIKKIGWLALLLSLIAVLLVSAAGCRSSAGTKVNFLRDWEVAKDQAASDGKPIMINFYTDT
jgi:hypothetical protein